MAFVAKRSSLESAFPKRFEGIHSPFALKESRGDAPISLFRWKFRNAIQEFRAAKCFQL
jgi:hypothetical protein